MFERERIDIGECKFRRIYRDLGLHVRPRKKRKVAGGTANAVRTVLRTGKPTEGSFHLEKAAGRLKQLESIMKDKNLTSDERKVRSHCTTTSRTLLAA
jgi:hypothetical protein